MAFCAGLAVLVMRRKGPVDKPHRAPHLPRALRALPSLLAHHQRVLPPTGITPRVVLTGNHAGIVTALLWHHPITISFFAATAYIGLDTEMHFTHVFSPSFPLNELKSIPMFVLTSGMAIYLVPMAYIVLYVLNEGVLSGGALRAQPTGLLFADQGHLQEREREDRRELRGDDMGDGGCGRAIPHAAGYHQRSVLLSWLHLCL
ncbi:hypothetical protein FIBSPDRAFT_199355 [Athelia psychrophila]|uniref:Uncharacterized protein n=1 Tax=Athelia psychrophila TaxID=1759441 RepID=A0A165ZQG2_9AGAM|nr:hypothetical protein FIBSPDRAFT_199355 [Fibularhizoctonia sp. CBS 109695]